MAQYDTDVLVLGDGPMGLTAALFLARNGLDARVLGEDQTPMHKALLHNQPGVPGMPGAEFMRILREQAGDAGAHLHRLHAKSVQKMGERFELGTPHGDLFRARWLVLATGRNRNLAECLGLEMTAEGNVVVDLRGRTSAEGVYAGGNLARGITQCAISVGDGANAALDILSRERGEPVRDYDVAQAPREASPGGAAWAPAARTLGEGKLQQEEPRSRP